MRRKWLPGVTAVAAAVTVLGLPSTPATAAEGARSDQWYLDAMNADALWSTTTGEGVTVALIDSGVNKAVPELRGQVTSGQDFIGEPKNPYDDSGSNHGTWMAALIAGTGAGGGVKGLAPGARILSLKTMDDKYAIEDGRLMAAAIRFAAESDARIINISQGVQYGDTADLQEAVDYAVSKGKLIFAATGNDGDQGNEPDAPATLDGVVGVSAVDKKGTVTKWSAHGPHVALAAPGDQIPGRCEQRSGMCLHRGTSHATAITSASAALIWSRHPDWTANQVLRVMMQTASKPAGKIPSRYLGYGVVRPAQVLVRHNGDPGDPEVNPLFPDYRPGSGTTSPPSPENGANGRPAPSPEREEPAENISAAPDDENDSDNTVVWVGVSVLAAVVIAAAWLGLTRMRKSRT
ncbi:S8 family serine peptidase [Streptomyces pactum]|uniref:S8 family serine peptidase n=1 Tax=Streptomyces pactum TaxID=68249 RepID=A0ABS0NQC0_9ACTN|nr:S8 family serine peptidase [Streptomyces pactum]MBH5337292.1 S8 family serine peptidase [Streptomyces pactum]